MARDKPAPQRLRIIAGTWRGRRLRFPAGTNVRPTADRVRETLFNWLGTRIDGTRCLDLYAGTGMLGLEALSRGAREAWFVERDRRLASHLGEQLGILAGNGRVFCEKVESFLRRPPGSGFDLVFIDPPYATAVDAAIAGLATFLAPDALLYLERAADDGLPESDALRWRKTGRAGAVCFGLAQLAVVPEQRAGGDPGTTRGSAPGC